MDDSTKLEKLLKKAENGLPLSPLEENQLAELRDKHGLTSQGTVKTKAALAEVLGVSRKTIYQWLKEGGMPVEPDGTFDLDHILEWRAARGKGKGEDDPKGAGTEKVHEKIFWEIRFRRARARLADLAYQKELKALISRAEVEALLVERAIEFKKALLGRGRRLSLRLAHKDAQECQQILDADSLAILETYSRGHRLLKPAEPLEEKSTRKKSKRNAARPRGKKTGGNGDEHG